MYYLIKQTEEGNKNPNNNPHIYDIKYATIKYATIKYAKEGIGRMMEVFPLSTFSIIEAPQYIREKKRVRGDRII